MPWSEIWKTQVPQNYWWTSQTRQKNDLFRLICTYVNLLFVHMSILYYSLSDNYSMGNFCFSRWNKYVCTYTWGEPNTPIKPWLLINLSKQQIIKNIIIKLDDSFINPCAHLSLIYGFFKKWKKEMYVCVHTYIVRSVFTHCVQMNNHGVNNGSDTLIASIIEIILSPLRQ